MIRKIPELGQYPGRYDPTVVPVDNSSNAESAAKAVSAIVERRKGDYGYYTSADYHALYKSGELTPTAVIETLLPQVRRDTQPPGKHSVAFFESQSDLIRAAADESTERYKTGKSLGPLDGVPVAVKDEVHVTGYKRTLGSKLDFKHGTDATSWCVRQWQEAGAIIIGKTSMHEIGLGELLLFSVELQ